MPKVSVIIPVYNVEQYLRQCLDSVVNQTLKDIEIICVNDGSEDDSLSILTEYAAKDKRMIVLNQENRGAGAARNRGLKMAKGKYLSFLDADDFFELNMLKEAYSRCKKENADICIYKVNRYHEPIKNTLTTDYAFNQNYLPKHVLFSYKDMPKYIFNTFHNWPFNKLFSKKMIDDNNLFFQEIKRTNDLLFTCTALVTATRITILNKILVYYRTGIEGSSQATNYEAPLEFYKAFISLKHKLMNMGIFDEVEQSFVNHALSGCIYNLNSLDTTESFVLLYNKLKNKYFKELGITKHPLSFYYSSQNYNLYNEILNKSALEFLFSKSKELQTAEDFDRFSYKIGRVITCLPRKLLRPWQANIRKFLRW